MSSSDAVARAAALDPQASFIVQAPAGSGKTSRRVQRLLSQPFFVAEQFVNIPGCFVPLDKTIRSFKEVLEGKHDDVPEQAFYMVGSIDDVLAKAKTMKERP